MEKAVLFLRPYYGFNIHSDAHGELGMMLNTHDVYPDLTLLTAATVFSESGEYQVRVIDAIIEDRMLPDELLKRLENEHYDVIFLKTTGQTLQSDIMLLKAISELMPEADIKICGTPAGILKKWLIKHAPYIDEVIGEPVDEYALQYVRKKKGGFVDMPIPDYTLVDYKGYRDAAKGLRLTLAGSRGCPMSCVYCPYKLCYKGYETKSTDRIIDNIKKLVELGADEIQFRDQYFSADRKRTRELFEKMLEQGIKTRIVCETGIDSLDEDMLQLMKNAGVGMICFGVETADAGLLKDYNSIKGETKRVKRLIDHAHSIGIDTMGFYIIGFPEETWDMAKSTYELSEYLDTTYVVYNQYELCLFDTDDTEYTPDLFPPFRNRTGMDYPSVLSNDEREYLAHIFDIRYAMRTSYKDSYLNNYKLIRDNRDAAEKLRPIAADLTRLSEGVRELRKNGRIDP